MTGRPTGAPDDGLFLIRHADVVRALTDPRLVRERPTDHGTDGGGPPLPALPGAPAGSTAGWAVFTDPPEHTRLRSLLRSALRQVSPDRIETVTEDAVTELLDAWPGGRPTNFVTHVAERVPLAVAASLFGFAADEADMFRTRAHQMLSPTVQLRAPFAARWRANESGYQAITRLFRRLIARRREHPADDMVSHLIGARHRGSGFDDAEVLSNCWFLLVTGYEPTVHLLSSAALALARHGAPLAASAGGTEALDDLIAEVLRSESPLPAVDRWVADDVTIGSRHFARGDRVFLGLAAANRDPAVFPAGDAFDPATNRGPGLAFGSGIHRCLGADMARLQARVVVRCLLDRGIRLPGNGKFHWHAQTGFRGLSSLPIVLSHTPSGRV